MYVERVACPLFFTICDFVSDLRAPTPSAAAELAVPDKQELLQYYDSQKQYLSTLIDSRISDYKNSLSQSASTLSSLSPQNKLRNIESELAINTHRLTSLSNQIFENKKQEISLLASRLESLNPVSILKRGYSVVTKDDKTVTSVKDVKDGDTLAIDVTDGRIISRVIGE